MHKPHSLRRVAAWTAALCGLAGAIALAGCGGGDTAVHDDSGSSTGWSWVLPSFFPTPKVPASNPMTAEKAELGRVLFYDSLLSGNFPQACASCHTQSTAFSHAMPTALSSTGHA